MKIKRIPWLTGLQVLMLVMIAANLLMTAELVGRPQAQVTRQRSLPCEFIPWEFVSDYPECADHLLHAMNVTNVHVRRFNGTVPGSEIENDPTIKAWRAARAQRDNATQAQQRQGPSRE